MKSTRRAATVSVVVTSLLAACVVAGASAKSSSGQATVTISVASLIPGSTPAAVKEFENQVAQFEKATDLKWDFTIAGHRITQLVIAP
jgi:ABC-type glycerol-3-phosphate transport system substrate-binding protein